MSAPPFGQGLVILGIACFLLLPATASAQEAPAVPAPPAEALQVPRYSRSDPAAAPQQELTSKKPAIQRISINFLFREMSWVTATKSLQKALRQYCPTLQLEAVKSAQVHVETTFYDSTAGWFTVIMQNGAVVDHFKTTAFESHAPSCIAVQICSRLGHPLSPDADFSVKLPQGRWEGKVIHQTSNGEFLEEEGSISVDETSLKIADAEDVHPVRVIPIEEIRDARFIGHKKELPLPGWDSLLEGSAGCGQGAGLCLAAGVAGLATYSVLHPLLSKFIPTRHSIEFIVVEQGEFRLLAVRLKPGSYERFASAVTRGSKATFTIIKPMAVGAP